MYLALGKHTICYRITSSIVTDLLQNYSHWHDFHGEVTIQLGVLMVGRESSQPPPALQQITGLNRVESERELNAWSFISLENINARNAFQLGKFIATNSVRMRIETFLLWLNLLFTDNFFFTHLSHFSIVFRKKLSKEVNGWCYI